MGSPARAASAPAVRERPILFSGPMVRALLDGRKTITRRLMKPQPTIDRMGNLCWKGACFGQGLDGRPWARELNRRSPLGQPGDRLWVRETWALAFPHTDESGRYVEDWSDWTRKIPKKDPGSGWQVLHAATYGEQSEPVEDRGFRYRPSIHMPRWASRLTLEVVSVRAERLQDITEEDAKAEGVMPVDDPFQGDAEYWQCYEPKCVREGGCAGVLSARKSFETLWRSINGAESWDANPWVWRIEMRRVEVRHG
ncbi:MULTISPECIES: hypothetical protein [unclassified Corallococcus]|uniref:hypothetical protein n=1 Tax=unclassified Corallococcus TaxID=2685029 RepID=UPI001A8DF19E|nr:MULTISPECIES: hypothetical protein [unclassified Corallococcus]MBN9687160.1 hypothetical protein [Corallococcus sp. NCSPR001]WAS89013.1 hypothetical protein O0N60_19020 [Corallococcus sp. NCRR]